MVLYINKWLLFAVQYYIYICYVAVESPLCKAIYINMAESSQDFRTDGGKTNYLHVRL